MDLQALAALCTFLRHNIESTLTFLQGNFYRGDHRHSRSAILDRAGIRKLSTSLRI